MLFPAIKFVLTTLLGLATTVTGNRSLYSLKERHHVPRKWSRIGPAPSQHMIQLQIGLKQSQFSELERQLYEVSDPGHLRYGQHLSEDEINQLIKPTDETLEQVLSWLRENNIEDQYEYSRAKDWIRVTLSVESVEKLLDTKYSIFKHEDGSYLVRTPEWSLPLHLHDQIQTIQPTNSFFRMKPERSTLKIAAADEADIRIASDRMPSSKALADVCNVNLVTPECLRTLYGTINYAAQSTSNNSIGMTNYLGETSVRSDVSIFLSRFRPDASANFTLTTIASGSDQQTPNTTSLAAGKNLEGNLDAETILGIAFPTPMEVYNTGGSPPFVPDLATPTNTNEPYLDWLQFMLGLESVPQVISTSYGDDEQTVPLSFATAVCNGFAQLGARGVSLLFASGDNGVGSNGDCVSNDGKNTNTFLPIFPGSCPFVTTVGGTMRINPEVVAFNPGNNYASGGGFSNYFSRPAYQDAVVPAYITSLGDQFKGLYNTSGRGYPDISAQGFHYATIWNGTVVPLDGTSASTPATSAIISLLNDALLAAGKPVLGFLNPWLYSNGFKALTDVTSGSARGCDGAGFPSQVGWDAVSGFGTPDFPKLKAAALDNGIF
ncbi:peptidase S8/S53 domain-containing protein [Rhexocercosporidium sp. MPI-PUGE-AT-0058]|nr:peptidase S8/S53 domain-containing protein [Rhexocercosporidium sp. MPI-PUGE-AT-0058]